MTAYHQHAWISAGTDPEHGPYQDCEWRDCTARRYTDDLDHEAPSEAAKRAFERRLGKAIFGR
jgi:hypothetical protein